MKILSGLIVLGLALSARADMPRTAYALAWRDTTSVLSAPARWRGGEWLAAAGGLALIGGTALGLDDPLRDAAARNHGRAMGRFANIAGPFGAEYSIGVLGGLACAGWALDDGRLRAMAFDGAVTSVLAAGILCQAIKVTAGRGRPYQSDTPWRFRPFGGRVSFPSGHTTQAFSVLSVVAFHSDSLLVQSLCFSLAAAVGWSRIYHDRHWTSDVVGGALLGTAVGRAVVTLNNGARAAEPRSGVRMQPWWGQGAGGLAVTAGLP